MKVENSGIARSGPFSQILSHLFLPFSTVFMCIHLSVHACNIYQLLVPMLVFVYPGEKERVQCMHSVFMPNFACITAWYHPKPFISSAIEKKIKKGVLRFCVCSNLRLLSFDIPEYRPLQACFNVKTPLLIIFELLAPARLGVTRHKKLMILFHV